MQEKLVQQWAEAKNLWSDTAEQDIESEYGSMIAKGAEAKVYYKDGDTSVIKIRTSIYARRQRVFLRLWAVQSSYSKRYSRSVRKVCRAERE